MSSSMSPEEIRAAAEVHDELGPRYRDAVIESFLDKVGREIDARVDARLAQQASAQPAEPAHPARPAKSRPDNRSALPLAVVSLVFGIPLTAITVGAGPHPVGLPGLIVVWAAIAVINVAYNLGQRRR